MEVFGAIRAAHLLAARHLVTSDERLSLTRHGFANTFVEAAPRFLVANALIQVFVADEFSTVAPPTTQTPVSLLYRYLLPAQRIGLSSERFAG